MSITIDQLLNLVQSNEDEHLDFKDAKDRFSHDKLLRYCCAFANERGGKLILGVSDQRQIVGSHAFEDLNEIKSKLISNLNLKIDVTEFTIEQKRVLVFSVPSRPIGQPKSIDGRYWMRRGESLVPMTEDMLKRIFDEAVPDYSAQYCSAATMDDLSGKGIEEFRKRWIRRSGNERLTQLSQIQLLYNAELINDEDQVTYAALALFGKRRSLGQLNFAHAEVIFEYRSKEITGPANQREVFRQGFFLYYDRLWELVNLRNDMQHFQDGLFMREIPTFSERSIREAVLNAISHRDYQNPGSVFIRQFPEKIEIVSPGSFPDGITPENILDKQMPRNRRIAETFEKCGLVERAGQGADRMFDEAIEQGKDLPDYSSSDFSGVVLKLDGRVRDESFLKYLEKASSTRDHSFTTHELLVLDALHRDIKIESGLRHTLQILSQDGVIEKVAHRKFILSKKYYDIADQKGSYTRRKGLDRETNKLLLLKHIRDNSDVGSSISEFRQILPEYTDRQIRTLVDELRKDGLVQMNGYRRSSKYYTIKN